ncbi:protein tramtrack, beta isoform-like isoform X5 [Neocloeon triangulifer]|uniref:protein tramtrack, beta isoform-like isoform X5 n=1 Tax=Neocloeon triangulifer TaxID=2078957 RepID=UPI00286F9400|nr:protein tramtrack, beta isoform-like isoform X5 [Neocloeon triangulifer]
MSAVKEEAFDSFEQFEGPDQEFAEYDASDPLSHGLFVQSARGVIRLVDSLGYIYHKDRHCPDNNKTYWRCQRRNLNCKCRAVTLANYIVGINGLHYHGSPKDTPGASEASWPAVNSAQVVQRLKSGDLLSAPQSMTSRDTKPILPKPSTSAMTPPYLDSPQQTQQQQPRPQQPKTPKAAPKPKATVSQQPIVENDDSEPQQVCLRWNSFHSNMETMFPTLLYKEKFVDVTLACEGRIIKCHKVVLSSCSPYLERLLSDNPCKHPIILMPKDVPYWALRAIVDFMYRGEVNVEHEQLAPLLAAAESLQIKGLAGSPGGTGGKKDGRPAVKRKKSDLPAQAVQQKFIPQQSQAPSQPQQSTSSQPTTTAQSTKNKEDKESPAHKHPRMDPNIAESLRGLSPGIEITPLVSFEDIKSEPMDSNDEDGSLEPTEDYGIGKGYDDGEESLPVSHVESLMEEEDLGDESDTLNDHSQIPDPNDLLSTEMEPIDEDDSVNVYSENGMDFPDCGLSEEGTDLVESYPEVCMPSDPGEHDGS